MTDIDPALVHRWRASSSAIEQVAARLADELHGKPRWEPVEGSFRIAIRMGVSQTTVLRAKVLLADHGAIMKDSSGSTTGYYVT